MTILTPEFLARRERIATVMLHALLTTHQSQLVREMLHEETAPITELSVRLAEQLLRELELTK